MDRISIFYIKDDPKVRRIFVAPQQRVPQKSKSFHIIQIYYKFLCVAGLDFGFFESDSFKRRIFLKTMMFAVLIVYCFGFILLGAHSVYRDSLYFNVFNIFVMIFYIVNVLSLLNINKSQTIHSALLDLQRIDSALKVDLSNITELIMITVICLYTALNIILHVLHCKVYGYCNLAVLFAYILNIFQQSVLFTYSLIFILIRYRFKELSSVLKTDFDCRALQDVYKSLVDLAVSQKVAFDPMFIVALLYYIPLVMWFIYHCIYPDEWDVFNVNLTEIVTRTTVVLKYFVEMVGPALCAGTLASQTSQIKLILHDILIDVQDESRAREIERFIQYVQERDCRFRVYQLIPLDASLIGMVLNFCVTYLIVIIQFSIK